MLKLLHKNMITLKTLRAFILGMPDDTKMGIDDDQVCLVFREPSSCGVESILESGRLEAHGAHVGESGDLEQEEI
jgi:hypothetical protein